MALCELVYVCALCACVRMFACMYAMYVTGCVCMCVLLMSLSLYLIVGIIYPVADISGPLTLTV